MYNLKKRAYYSTLGELRMLLADLPDETEVFTCGVEDSWIHFEKDGSFISFDYDSLGCDYCEDLENEGITDDEMESRYEAQQLKEHQWRMEAFFDPYPADCERTLDYIDF